MKKRITLLLAVLLALLLHVPQVMAQETCTVADGTELEQHVPIYGYYADNYGNHTQFIFPASMLEEYMLPGSAISKLQFYSTDQSVSLSATWSVKIGMSPYAAYPSLDFLPTTDLQQVYSGTLGVSGGIMTVQFSNDFIYTGGNVVVDFNVTSAGGYSRIYFSGVTSQAAGLNSYGYGASQYNFIPKTTFTFVQGEEPDCWKAKHLSAENITANSAVLVWEDGGKSDGWYVEYRVAGDSASVVSIPDYIEETTYTLTGLNPTTSYEFRVIADCGGDPSDWTAWASFRTACGTISQLPFTEGFENVATGSSYALPFCWERFNDAGTTASSVYNYCPYVYSSANYAHTGNGLLYFYTSQNSSYSSYSDHQIAVLPEVDVNVHPMNTLRLRFWAKRNSSYAEAPLIIGVMADPTDLGTFMAVDTVLVSNTDNQEFTVYFSDYVGGAAYPAIRLDRQSSACYCYVDDITIDLIPSCFRPTDVTVSDITAFSADVAWTVGKDETAWNIDYKPANDSNATWTTVPVTASPYTLGNLTPNTVYELRMQSDCGSETSEWTNPVQFKTPCDVREVTTFVEGAEGTTGDALPDCWTTDHIVKVTPNTSAPFYTQNTTKQGTRGFALRDMTSGNIAYLCSQALDFGTAGTYSFRYKFYRPSGTSALGEGLRIMVTPTPGDTAAAVEVIPFVNRCAGNAPVGEAGAWNIYEGVINYSGVGYIMVVGYSKYSSTSYFDDLEVFLTPSCEKPANPTVVAVTTNSAEIAWENGASESAWNIRYRVVGDTSWTVVAADANPFNLTGLTANTPYECQIQADCGAGDVSDWSNRTASFRTSLGIPYNESFNASAFPALWSRGTGLVNDVISGDAPIGSTTSGWNITSSSNGLPASHIKVNVFGTTCKYWAISPSVYINDPNAVFSFDVALTKYNSSSTAAMTGSDDRFIALISNDNGNTWAILREWNNTGSEYVYNNIANGGESVEIPLVAYNNQNVKVAFYAESTTSNADNDLHVANAALWVTPTCYPVSSVKSSGVGRREFTVRWTPNAAHAENVHGYQLVIDTVELNDSALAAATPIVVDNATSYKFEGLYRNTTYHVYVRTNCDVDDGFGAWTSIAVKTNAPLSTPCPQLTNFRVDSITANAAKFTWTASNADYVGDYNLHIATAEMTDSMLNELASYTYTGADNSYYPTDLTELTQYYAYVRVNCTDGDVDDGASVWTMVPFKTYSSCPAPIVVSIDSVERYSMRVNWVMPATMVDSSSTYTYDVEVRDSNEAVVYSFTNLAPLTRNIKVTNLMRGTLYNVYVRTNCGEGTSPWEKASATTKIIPGVCAIIADGTTTNEYVPVYGSYCDEGIKSQMIYPASMLEAIMGKTLTQMKFFVASGTNAGNWDYATFNVKIGITSADNLSSGFVSSGDATTVYFGTVVANTTDGMLINFTTPFTYTGGNLLIEFEQTNTTSYYYVTFYGSSAPAGSSRYAHNDYDYGWTGYAQSFLPKVDFNICEPGDPCPALRIAPVSSDRTHNSARLTWTDAKGDWANTYEIYLDTVPMNDSVEITPTYTGIDTVSYVATGLASGKTYYAYVRVKCDKGIYDDGISGWSPVCIFETELPCLRPSMLTRSHVTSNSVDLTWLEANGATAWDIELSKYVPNDTAVDTIVNVIRVTDVTYDSLGTTVNYTLTGLDAKTFYSLRVRTQCEALSQWGYDVVNFTTQSNNTDIDTIAFSEYYGNVPTVISYNRNGDNFDIVVRADASLEDMYIAVGVHDYYANVKVNGKPQNYWTGIDFNDETPVVFTVIAQDTNFRHDYNVFVHHETCATPYDIAVTNIGRRSATITWNIGATDLQNYDYVVAYEELSDPEEELVQHFADTLKTHDIVVDRDTMCYIYFRHSCGLEQSEWISTSFRSKGLENCDNYLTIGSASSTSQYIPGYTFYNTALSCQIYTPSEIGQSGEFTSLYFNSSRTCNNGRNVKIYMVETDKREFTSSTDWFKVTSADLVYSGTINYVNGWNEITLSRPFTYSGTKNLVIVYDDNTGSYETGPNFTTFNDADGKNSAIYQYNDSQNLDPESTISASANGRLTQKNQIKLGYCYEINACPEVENITVSDLQATEVTLKWTSNADYPGFYDVYVSETQVVDFTMVVPTVTVRETMATVTGLTQLTHYYVYVRTRCDRGDGNSEWAESEFTTQANCYAPLSITSAVTGKQTAHVAWVPGTDQQANNFAYVLSTTPVELDSLDMMAPTAQGIATDYVDLNGLASATHYYFYVHNDCGEKGGSPWKSTEFTTPAFQPQVINLEVSDITYNTFVASWERDSVNFASETEWQIAWAPVNDSAALNWINVSETSRMIFGLAAETPYVFYVRPFENGNPGDQATANVTTLADPGACLISGTGTSTTHNIPCANFYNYGYSQQIFDASELNAGQILSLAFQYGYTTAMTKTNVKIYLGHTSKSTFASTTDWVAIEDLTEVYSGPFNCSGNGNFNTFALTTPFNYNGSDNLVVAVHKESNGYEGMSYVFRNTSCSGTKTLYYQNDNTACPADAPVAGTLGTFRNNIEFCFAPVSCPAPKAVAASNINTTSADITWRPGGVETEWEYVYAYAPMTDDELAAATATSVTYPAASLANLTIDADVYVYVRSKCGDDDYSAWAKGQFRTIETCSAPVALNGYSVDENQMTMTVRHGQYGDTLNYTYEYWMVGSTDTMTITGSDTVVVNVPEAGTYTFRAKATCQTETPDGISRWTAYGSNVVVCGAYNISDTKNYVQGFEGIYSVADACMTVDGGYQDPYVYDYSYYAHSGSKMLYFHNGTSSYSSYESFAAMPKFNSNEEIFFSFYYKNYSTSASYGQFIYGYQTADGTFYPVDTLDRKSSYTQVRRSMNELPDSAANVALKFANGNYYGYLDDIRVAVQRESTINDTLAGIETRYNKNGFSIYRTSFKAGQTDTVLTRLAQNGVVDTMYTLNLHLGSLTRDTLRDTVCPNVPYTFYTKTIDNPRTGWYYDTLATGAGNNVIHSLRLTVLDAAIDIVADTQTVCGSYNWRGRELTQSGVYYDTVRNALDCDLTVYELTLTVNPTYYVSETMAICQGSSYLWRGRDLTIAGVYYDSLQTVAGCDSIYKLTLIVNPTYLVAETMAICQGSSYAWHGRDLTEAGVYVDTVQTVAGCDSVCELTLTVTYPFFDVEDVTANGAKLPYIWHGMRLSKAGVYYDSLTTVTGCDSVFQLNLSIEYPAVANLRAEDILPDGFTAKWTKVGTETRWWVLVTTNRATDPDTLYYRKAYDTTCVITGLDANVTYKLTVTPDLTNKTCKSKTIKVTTAAVVCVAPTDLVAQMTDLRSFSISWNNGSADQPNNFTIVYADKQVEHPEYRTANVTGLKTTSLNIVNKSYGTTYYIYVRNVYAGVASEWVETQVTTYNPYEAVMNLQSDNVKNTSFHLTWNKHPFGRETRWNVVVARASDNVEVFMKKVKLEECLVTGLEANTDYIVTVSPAIGSHITDPATINVTTADDCAAPVIISATQTAARTLEFVWSNGSDYQENNFTFIVAKKPLTALDTRTKTMESYSGTSYVVEKASVGVTYYFYIKNVWDDISSEWVECSVYVEPEYSTQTKPDGEDAYTENVEFITETVVPAEAYVNMDKLYVENLVEGSDVMVIDGSGRILYNAKVNDTRMEYNLYVRGIYMVVVRGKQEQTIKVVY